MALIVQSNGAYAGTGVGATAGVRTADPPPRWASALSRDEFARWLNTRR